MSRFVCVLVLLFPFAAVSQTAEQAGTRAQKADAAIAKLDEKIAAVQAEQSRDAGLLSRLRKDRVAALRDGERWRDALEQAEELRRGGDELPPYVLQAEADSLLALRRPQEARLAYQAVIDAEPENQAAIIGRFFSEVETEDFRAAFATADGLAAKEKELAKSRADSAPGNQGEKIDNQITAALARYYASMDAEAWDRLNYLAQKHPDLGYLRVALGKVAAARGWSRRGAEEVETGARLSPSDMGSQIALADSLIWLRQYSDARSGADGLATQYPGNQAVRNLVQEARVAYRWYLESQLDSYHEISGDSNAQAPGSGLSIVNRIYSPLMAEHWRMVGGFAYWNANPIEGFVDRYRQGGGIEYRRSFLTLEADGWSNTGTLNHGGASLKIDWKATDHWDFETTAEYFSVNTPLRALLYGITANEASVGVGYDWHESRGLAANFHALHFSDSNQRSSGGVRFAQSLVTQPHVKLTIRPEVYASGNTASNAPYFNPSQDFSAFASADADHIMRRHYEHVWRQRITAGAGAYWQQGYGTAPIASASYEQNIEFNALAVLRYGVSYARRVYDAGPVNSVTASIGLSWRF